MQHHAIGRISDCSDCSSPNRDPQIQGLTFWKVIFLWLWTSFRRHCLILQVRSDHKYCSKCNLPQCCVLIALLYCGLVKFFFFVQNATRRSEVRIEVRTRAVAFFIEQRLHKSTFVNPTLAIGWQWWLCKANVQTSMPACASLCRRG